MSPQDMMVAGAFLLLAFVVFRGRKRIRCLEIELQKKKMNPGEVKPQRTDLREEQVAKTVDWVRALEARVQNRAYLLEILIEEADQRLNPGANRGHGILSKEFRREVEKGMAMGKSDAQIASDLGRHPQVISHLKAIWKEHS